MRGLSPEEIREQFNISKDGPEKEEDERMKRENAWNEVAFAGMD